MIVDGVMHVMWVQEGGLEDGWKRLYEVWYRRSDDLGKTWSEPVCVADNCYDGGASFQLQNSWGFAPRVV